MQQPTQQAQLLTIKKPSKILERLTDKCVSEFGKLNKTVNAALERGRIEGFDDREVGNMIRDKLIKAGYSRMTVSRYLPASAKNKPRGIQVSAKDKDKDKISNNLLQNGTENRANQAAAIKAASAISNKMLQNPKLSDTSKVGNTFEFMSKINKMGSNRVIWIEKRLHPQIERFEGKTLEVTIRIK
jgi:hypothetical protein